jgi:hypothetical protein
VVTLVDYQISPDGWSLGNFEGGVSMNVFSQPRSVLTCTTSCQHKLHSNPYTSVSPLLGMFTPRFSVPGEVHSLSHLIPPGPLQDLVSQELVQFVKPFFVAAKPGFAGYYERLPTPWVGLHLSEASTTNFWSPYPSVLAVVTATDDEELKRVRDEFVDFVDQHWSEELNFTTQTPNFWAQCAPNSTVSQAVDSLAARQPSVSELWREMCLVYLGAPVPAGFDCDVLLPELPLPGLVCRVNTTVPSFKQVVMPFNSTEQLEAFVTGQQYMAKAAAPASEEGQPKFGAQVYAAVVLNSVSADKTQWDYSLRLNATHEHFFGGKGFNFLSDSQGTPETLAKGYRRNVNPFQVALTTTAQQQYAKNGFMTLQTLLDRYIVAGCAAGPEGADPALRCNKSWEAFDAAEGLREGAMTTDGGGARGVAQLAERLEQVTDSPTTL